MDKNKLETNEKDENKNDIVNEEKIVFEKGNFTEEEHRLFLEAFILYDKNFQEMTNYIKTKNYNDIIIYTAKYINYLENKYKKHENSFSIKIDKDKIKEYSNEELEEYINYKHCSSSKNSINSYSGDDYFIDDNKSILGLNNNKKIFFIRKYPKYKTLLEKNEINDGNNSLNGINIPNIGNDKESRKKLINKLLNENCKETNYTRIEEHAKMSEILQIINKTENNYNLNHGLSEESSNTKTKSFITNETNQNIKNNDINDLNNSNLGKKRNIHFKSCVEKDYKENNDLENELKEKTCFTKLNINNNDNNNENNNNNNNNTNTNTNNNNNTNLFPNNNLINNISNYNILNDNITNNFIPNQHYQLNQMNNIINPNMNMNLNQNQIFNPFQRNNSFDQLFPQQMNLLPPPIFNLPYPILGLTIPNINNMNMPIMHGQNFQNLYLSNQKFGNPNQNLMDYMVGNNNNENLMNFQNFPGLNNLNNNG